MLSQRVSRLPTATAARRLRLERGLVSIGVFPTITGLPSTIRSRIIGYSVGLSAGLENEMAIKK